METPGLQETVQLAIVFANFLGETMKVGMEGIGLLFGGGAGIAKGSYALLLMAKREHDQHLKDQSRFRKGSYSMNRMIKVCSQKNVNPLIMRIRNDETTIAEFERYAHDNKLAYSIMPDLNTHDEYIEIMYPDTQAIQYTNFMKNINRKAAFSITLDEYLNNASPDKQQEMQSIIDNLSEEEKKLINPSTEKIDNKSEQSVQDTYDAQIVISDQQLLKKENGMATIAVMDDNNKECIVTVPETAVSRGNFGYSVKLNGSEQLSYVSSTQIILDKSAIVRETNSSYVFVVPNTNGELYTAFDKRNCSLEGNNITVSINETGRYQILDKHFNFSHEIVGKELYKGHFDKQLVSSNIIKKFSENYQKFNKILIPGSQPTQGQRSSQFLFVEVRPDMIKDIPGTQKSTLITSKGEMSVNKSNIILSRDRQGNKHAFIKLPAAGSSTIHGQGMTNMEAASLLRIERSKTQPKITERIDDSRKIKKSGKTM